jgi:hypothetical protein
MLTRNHNYIDRIARYRVVGYARPGAGVHLHGRVGVRGARPRGPGAPALRDREEQEFRKRTERGQRQRGGPPASGGGGGR